MIESRYWKKDLLNYAKSLKSMKVYRWSEKRMVNFEKSLIVAFFMIRKLFETHKVSQKSRKYKTRIFSHTPTGVKITARNQYAISEVYNLQKECEIIQDISFIANQFIHSSTIFAYRERAEGKSWDGVYICSDFKRNKVIYRIPTEEVIKIFELVENDYPSKITMTWSTVKNDYDIKAN